MFTLSNEARMGSEYPSSKKVDVCDLPCNNLAKPNSGKVLGNSGSDAMGYLGKRDNDSDSNSIVESTGYRYNRKSPGTKWATYDPGDE